MPLRAVARASSAAQLARVRAGCRMRADGMEFFGYAVFTSPLY
jgi:hypothetical protein